MSCTALAIGQIELYHIPYLPLANEVWGKVMFLHLSVIHSVRGVGSVVSLPVEPPT